MCPDFTLSQAKSAFWPNSSDISMTSISFSSFLQGRCANVTVMNPSCPQASCPHSKRDYFHIPQAPYTSRIVLQPSGECFNIPQATCTPNMCLQTNRDCLPAAQTMCSQMNPPPQECYPLNYSQSPRPIRCTKSPSRMLPLLPPHTRQSIESLCRIRPQRPASKRAHF